MVDWLEHVLLMQVSANKSQIIAGRRLWSQVLASFTTSAVAAHGVFCPEQDLFDSLTFDQTIKTRYLISWNGIVS